MFCLFACAFNLLIGYVGLISFGHAMFFGWASYLAAHAAKVVGVLPPELAVLPVAAIAGPPPCSASSSAASLFAVRASISP